MTQLTDLALNLLAALALPVCLVLAVALIGSPT